eukprot:6187740-Pleurochrysis_carterae.AAC.2
MKTIRVDSVEYHRLKAQKGHAKVWSDSGKTKCIAASLFEAPRICGPAPFESERHSSCDSGPRCPGRRRTGFVKPSGVRGSAECRMSDERLASCAHPSETA